MAIEKCDNCGKLHRSEDLSYVHTSGGEGRWCPDCVEDYAFECDDCGELWDSDLITFVGGTEAETRGICPDCLDAFYDQCDRCEEYFRRVDLEYVRSSGYWCPDCREDYAGYCEECDEWVPIDDYVYDEANDSNCCDRCFSEHRSKVRSYHDAPDLQYYGNFNRGMEFKGLGVELEVDDGENPDDTIMDLEKLHERDELYYEHDGSLGYEGFEIITQPHTEEAFYQIRWEEIMDTCSKHGYRSHDTDTCGLHVHVSRAMFGDTQQEQDMNIAKVVCFYEQNWEDMLKLSRRTAYSADRWAARYSTKDIPQEEAEEIVKSQTYHSARYHAINLTNYATVEFRLCKGTLCPSSFFAWIDLTLRLVDASRKVEWTDIQNIKAWLEGIKPETMHYIKIRHAFEDVFRQSEMADEEAV